MLLFFPEHKIKYIKIPKNACSSVINSLGWAVVQDRNPHSFDHVFHSTDEDTSDWPCLAVLRDPYERLVSAYLNKLIYPFDDEPFAGELLDTVWIKSRGMPRPATNSSITFQEFVEFVYENEDDHLDQHWQSQTFHLQGNEPTLVIDMESLREEWERNDLLKEIKLIDHAPHATRSTLKIEKDLSAVDGYDIHAFIRIADHFPPGSAFLNADLEKLVRRRYAADYDLRQSFGFQ